MSMTTLMNYDEVVQCVKQEIELTGIADKKHAKPDLRVLSQTFYVSVNIHSI